MCPTALLALRADGITLRLLYSFRLGSQTVVGLQFWKPPCPDKRGRLALMQNLTPTPLEGAQTSGTHQPKTVVVVTVVWIVVVAVRGARIVMIVVPRPAAQHPPGALQGTPQPISTAG
jgi:hypothetical protein